MELHERIERVVDDFANQHELTQREREIVRYLVSELCYEEIATKNYISPKTVKNHAANIFYKLKVKNRQQLMVKLLERIIEQQEGGTNERM